MASGAAAFPASTRLCEKHIPGPVTPRSNCSIQQITAGKYFDPYLDVRLPGRAASDMPHDPEASNIRLAKIDRQFRHLGDYIDVGRIFRYRVYLDLLGRLPSTRMLQLEGREDWYGRHWRLLRPSQRARTLPPFRRTIHARARFIYSEQAISQWIVKSKRAPIASPWAYSTISPWS
jgi:hypothetical protein